MYFTKDNYQTQYATRSAIRFPAGLAPPQGTKYGTLAQWGFGNASDLDTGTARNAEIYQWNLGVQHLLPGQIVIGVDYSANRSTHLAVGGSRRNFHARSQLPLSTPRATSWLRQSNPIARPQQHRVYGLPESTESQSCSSASLRRWRAAGVVLSRLRRSFNAADVVDSRYIDPTIPHSQPVAAVSAV